MSTDASRVRADFQDLATAFEGSHDPARTGCDHHARVPVVETEAVVVLRDEQWPADEPGALLREPLDLGGEPALDHAHPGARAGRSPSVSAEEPEPAQLADRLPGETGPGGIDEETPVTDRRCPHRLELVDRPLPRDVDGNPLHAGQLPARRRRPRRRRRRRPPAQRGPAALLEQPKSTLAVACLDRFGQAGDVPAEAVDVPQDDDAVADRARRPRRGPRPAPRRGPAPRRPAAAARSAGTFCPDA